MVSTTEGAMGLSPTGADANLSVDHLRSGLGRRSVRSTAVTVAAQAARLFVQVASTAFLARFLSADDFGLVAMVSAIAGFVLLVRDFGFSSAVVQAETIGHEQLTAIFWLNVAVVVGLASLLFAAGPGIATFYGRSELFGITVVLSLSLLIGGVGTLHQAVLRRRMAFTTLSTIDVIAFALGAAVGCGVAIAGGGYWAAVAVPTATALASTSALWMKCEWRPGAPTMGGHVKKFVRFGGSLTSFNVFNYWTRNADNIIVGYVLGGGPLGVYSRAYNLLLAPIWQFSSPVMAVLMPALSRLQGTPSRYRNAYLRSIQALAFAGMPVACVLYALSSEVVRFVLGPGWDETEQVFRLLAPAAFIGSINSAPGLLCVSLGRPQVMARWALISAPTMVLFFWLGVRWDGLHGVALAAGIGWPILFVIFVVMACRRSPVSLWDMTTTLKEPVVAALGAGVVVSTLLASAPVSGWSVTERLLTGLLTYATVYAALALATPSGRSLARAVLCHALDGRPGATA